MAPLQLATTASRGWGGGAVRRTVDPVGETTKRAGAQPLGGSADSPAAPTTQRMGRAGEAAASTPGSASASLSRSAGRKDRAVVHADGEERPAVQPLSWHARSAAGDGHHVEDRFHDLFRQLDAPGRRRARDGSRAQDDDLHASASEHENARRRRHPATVSRSGTRRAVDRRLNAAPITPELKQISLRPDDCGLLAAESRRRTRNLENRPVLRGLADEIVAEIVQCGEPPS